MVEVKDLKKYYSSRKNRSAIVKAVDGIDFIIEKGTTLGVVGESGSGKTTVARTILQLIEPTSGVISIDGQTITGISTKNLRSKRKDFQIVFQDPYSSLNPRISIGKTVGEPLQIHTKLTKEQIKIKVYETLELVGLSKEHYHRYPHEFSGGQRQRIGIARAIILNPKFLVLDESVSALDVSIQGQILNLLQKLQQKLQITYLFIAHDLAVVENICHNIAIMYLGKIVEYGTRDEIFSNPLHPYTKSLIDATPTIGSGKGQLSVTLGEIPSPENPPNGCYFHPRCPKAMDICKTKYPQTIDYNNRRLSCHLYQGQSSV